MARGCCLPRRRTVRPAPRGSTRCCRPCTAHARDAALKREILIADHVTWAVPVLLTLFLLRVEGRSDNAGLIKRRLEELNARRDKALRHDTLPLRRYGWQLTVLARRLRQLMERATGGSPFQLSLAPPDFSNGRRALAFVREDPPTNAANEESLRRLHRENYTKYVSGPAGMSTAHAPTLTRAPLQVQDSLMGSAQRHLGMPDIQRSPAILQAEALTLAICRRMADDTHSERRTRHLYPSPSLETATYRPGQYL